MVVWLNQALPDPFSLCPVRCWWCVQRHGRVQRGPGRCLVLARHSETKPSWPLQRENRHQSQQTDLNTQEEDKISRNVFGRRPFTDRLGWTSLADNPRQPSGKLISQKKNKLFGEVKYFAVGLSKELVWTWHFDNPIKVFSIIAVKWYTSHVGVRPRGRWQQSLILVFYKHDPYEGGQSPKPPSNPI